MTVDRLIIKPGTVGGEIAVWDNVEKRWEPEVPPTTPIHYYALNAVVDGGGAVVMPGVKGDLVVEGAGEIEGWSILPDLTGSVVFDIWCKTITEFPPSATDSICGTNKPTLANMGKAQGDVSGWSPDLMPGDVLRIVVDSAALIQRVTLELKIRG